MKGGSFAILAVCVLLVLVSVAAGSPRVLAVGSHWRADPSADALRLRRGQCQVVVVDTQSPCGESDASALHFASETVCVSAACADAVHVVRAARHHVPEVDDATILGPFEGSFYVVAQRDGAPAPHLPAGAGIALPSTHGSVFAAPAGSSLAGDSLLRVKVSSSYADLVKDATAAVARLDHAAYDATGATTASYNRYVGSSEMSDAAAFLAAQFTDLGLSVTVQPFTVRGYAVHNIVAKYCSNRTCGEKRQIIIGGHYDSISEAVNVAAPGAVDNASGAVGVIAMARALVQSPVRDHDLVFVLFSGEEEGLFGSKRYVNLLDEEERGDVAFMLNMDEIGYRKVGADNAVLLESSSLYKPRMAVFAAAASLFSPHMKVVHSYHPYASDHVPFLSGGIPALLSINLDEAYPSYHRTTDVWSNVVVDQSMAILRMNVGAVHLLGVCDTEGVCPLGNSSTPIVDVCEEDSSAAGCDSALGSDALTLTMGLLGLLAVCACLCVCLVILVVMAVAFLLVLLLITMSGVVGFLAKRKERHLSDMPAGFGDDETVHVSYTASRDEVDW